MWLQEEIQLKTMMRIHREMRQSLRQMLSDIGVPSNPMVEDEWILERIKEHLRKEVRPSESMRRFAIEKLKEATEIVGNGICMDVVMDMIKELEKESEVVVDTKNERTIVCIEDCL